MNNLDFYDREDRPWPNSRLTSASIIGHTTKTTTRIWVRVFAVGTYGLVVSKSPIDSTKPPSVIIPEADCHIPALPIGFDSDLTHVFDVEGLNPDTTYFYAVYIDVAPDVSIATPWEIGREGQCFFKTLPADPDRITFGLISCHMPYDKSGNIHHMEMWEYLSQTLNDLSAKFLIAGGDQVYVDGTDRFNIWSWLKKVKRDMPADSDQRIGIMRSWYRDIYRGYWGHLDLRSVFRQFPTYMMWDDHEIKDGWGSHTKKELANALDRLFEWQNDKLNLKLASEMFEAATLTYKEYQHSHNPPVSKPDQFDYSFQVGYSAFFFLDMRGHRDFNRADDKRPILGDQQMERLLKWIADSSESAEVLFIVSPVPVVHAPSYVVNHMDLGLIGIADDMRDEWEHSSNWTERDEMLDEVFRVAEKTGKRVVFLSGDVHIAAGFKLRRASCPNAKVFQLTSSSITYTGAPGTLLKLILRNSGDLGAPKTTKPNDKTAFSLLQSFPRNNFGMVRTERVNGGVSVCWEVYGRSVEEEGVLKMKRLTL